MKEAEAINAMLSMIGAQPVNDINIGHPDVANARRILERHSRKMQRRGWWFNRDYDLTFTPTEVTQRIHIPNYIQVEPACRNFVKRGDYMYDRINQTFQFTGPIDIISLIRYTQFGDLPDTAAETALYSAGAEFVRDEVEDPTKVRELKEEYKESLIMLKSEDMNNEQFNSFRKTRVARARQGVRPYGRYGVARIPGAPDGR